MLRSSTPVLSHYYFQLILLSKQAALVQLHVCHNVALQSNSLSGCAVYVRGR